MPLLGLDTDNGTEFLNAELIGYCTGERITFTRGRAYQKNDQCFVEPKNGSMVRHLVGYDRFEGEAAYPQLAERPELTARSILDQLQQQYPGEYPDNQLRTLQRRVKKWRASVMIQFDNAWSGEEELAGMTLPNPPRARLDGEVGQPLDGIAGVRSGIVRGG